jgi:molybdate transport system permease protein
MKIDLLKILMGLSVIVFIILIIMPFVALLLNVFTIESLNNIDYQEILKPLILSIIIAIIATFIVLIIGIPLAYLLTYYEFPFKNVLDVMINIPLVLSPAVSGHLLLLTFGRHGFIGYPLDSLFGVQIMFTTFAIVIAQVFVAMPFMVRSIKVSFQEVPKSMIDVSKTLGATDQEILRDVIIPLSKNGIMTGITLSFARAMGEFGATVMVSGLLYTLPIAIFRNIMIGDRDVANVLSFIVITISFTILILLNKIGNKKHTSANTKIN